MQSIRPIVAVGAWALALPAAPGALFQVPAGLPTIQAGVDAAVAGDTVLDSPGARRAEGD